MSAINSILRNVVDVIYIKNWNGLYIWIQHHQKQTTIMHRTCAYCGFGKVYWIPGWKKKLFKIPPKKYIPYQPNGNVVVHVHVLLSLSFAFIFHCSCVWHSNGKKTYGWVLNWNVEKYSANVALMSPCLSSTTIKSYLVCNANYWKAERRLCTHYIQRLWVVFFT